MGGSDARGSSWPQPERRSAPRRTRGDRRHTQDGVPPEGQPERRVESPARRARERRAGEEAWQALALDGDLLAGAAPAASLLAAAAAVRERAHAPYSGFRVGAALEAADGTLITGCNVESASYGLTICAERVALVSALAAGHAAFVRLAVVADTERPTPPCGACRQLLWEYCGDIEVHLGNLDGPAANHRLGALLPLPFDRTLLE